MFNQSSQFLSHVFYAMRGT